MLRTAVWISSIVHYLMIAIGRQPTIAVHNSIPGFDCKLNGWY